MFNSQGTKTIVGTREYKASLSLYFSPRTDPPCIITLFTRENAIGLQQTYK
jgi:hypothetical protein